MSWPVISGRLAETAEPTACGPITWSAATAMASADGSPPSNFPLLFRSLMVVPFVVWTWRDYTHGLQIS